MSTTTIENNSVSIKITENHAARFILKHQIRQVEIVRGTLIKIDIGQGALNNIYLDYVNVTVPITSTVEELREEIIKMLDVTSNGATTDSGEIQEIKNLQTLVESIQMKIDSLDDKIFYEPKLVDESNPNIVYNGFAAPGSSEQSPVWAIQKVIKENEIFFYQWATGNKNFDKVWSNRTELIYS